jgi:hypothetical protein
MHARASSHENRGRPNVAKGKPIRNILRVPDVRTCTYVYVIAARTWPMLMVLLMAQLIY